MRVEDLIKTNEYFDYFEWIVDGERVNPYCFGEKEMYGVESWEIKGNIIYVITTGKEEIVKKAVFTITAEQKEEIIKECVRRAQLAFIFGTDSEREIKGILEEDKTAQCIL